MQADYLLPLAVTLSHLAVAPYTKVEESFTLQATHDIIRHGVPTTDVAAYLKQHYDHISFPGVVPRSFVGPLLLAYASAPFRVLLGAFVSELLIGLHSTPSDLAAVRWLTRRTC